MKRIQYHRYGGPEEMRLETFELPAPGKGELLVRVLAASINPVDWKIRGGAMKFMTGRRFPRGMGLDFSGVVEAVGAGVTRLRVGDEVFGAVSPKTAGTFAEKVIATEKLSVKKPAAISHEAAATLAGVGATAWRGLVLKGRLQPGMSVFVNGAFGGVGQAVVQLAKALGASSVTGRVGPSAVADAAAIGIDNVLDYTQPIPANLHGQFDIVYDCNGALTPAEGDALIKRGGVVVDINPSTYKLIRSLYSPRHAFVMGTQDTELLQKLADFAGSGKLRIGIGRTAKLDVAIAMLSDLEAGRRTKGKAVIVME